MNGTHTPDALKKLTVSQLKSLCKENRIQGYSKLTKDAIIQKFLVHNSTHASKNVASPTIVEAARINVGSSIISDSFEHALRIPSPFTDICTTTLPPLSSFLVTPKSSSSNLCNLVSSSKTNRGTEKANDITNSATQLKPMVQKVVRDIHIGRKSEPSTAKGRFRKLVASSKFTSQGSDPSSTREKQTAYIQGCLNIEHCLQNFSISEDTYIHNFLSRALGSDDIFSEMLWTKSDHGMQTSILLRFLLTKLYFHVSIGLNLSSEWNALTVSDVCAIIPGEIWKISFQSGERFYILEHTCEVISHIQHPDSTVIEDELARDLENIRSDWAAYISGKLGENGINTSTTLVDHLKYSNHEEYDKGISRHWLRRIQPEGDIGTYKQVVAKRYIFACLMSNSISGSWMTAVEMSQEFNGLPEKIVPRKRKSPQLEMFLPTSDTLLASGH
ncbi:hypothetical protein BDQ17DRAFT_1343420 [Cyathus striatus]|nr:hypothetical protein BDQ17DRAFT_1343420 [Cyathus striatus]